MYNKSLPLIYLQKCTKLKGNVQGLTKALTKHYPFREVSDTQGLGATLEIKCKYRNEMTGNKTYPLLLLKGEGG